MSQFLQIYVNRVLVTYVPCVAADTPIFWSRWGRPGRGKTMAPMAGKNCGDSLWGGLDCREGMLRQEGLSPAYALPCVVNWDPETGRFTRVEGPDGFTTWEEAEEASRFLRCR